MTRILLDKDLARRLREVQEESELCDESGKTVGRFIPAHALEQIAVPFTEQELQEFEKEAGGRPLADILADLKKL